MSSAPSSSRLADTLTLGLLRRPGIRLAVRRALHATLRQALAVRSRPLPTPTPGSLTLVIAPHQDDEALGCGGLIFVRRRQGLPVHVLYVTDGGGSHPAHPTLAPAALVAQREAEARHALAQLGVDGAACTFLRAADGTLAHLDAATAEALIVRLAAVIRELGPREIFLPCRHDGSSEHDANFLLVQRALARLPARPRVFEFPVWSWWNPTLLLRPLRESRRIWRLRFPDGAQVKRDALASFVSQIAPTPPWTQPVLSPEFMSCFRSDEEFFFEP